MRSSGCGCTGNGGLAPLDRDFDARGPAGAVSLAFERGAGWGTEGAVRSGGCADGSCAIVRAASGGEAPAGQIGEAMTMATWNAMNVQQRLDWIRLHRADVAAEAAATASRETTAAARTAAERVLITNLATRGFDALFGADGIFRLSHARRLEELRQTAETQRLRIRAEADVEIARWNAQARVNEPGGAVDCNARCYGLATRSRRKKCVKRCRRSGGWIAAAGVLLAVL